jgi:hypothetical protein
MNDQLHARVSSRPSSRRGASAALQVPTPISPISVPVVWSLYCALSAPPEQNNAFITILVLYIRGLQSARC